MRQLPNNHGIALILVILMISVIVAATIQLNVASRAEIQEATTIGDDIMLLYVAKSGFNGAKALLIEDDNTADSLTEDWARPALISGMSEVLFNRGAFLLSIQDEAGKLPINELVVGNDYNEALRELLTRFLESDEFNLDEQQVRDIVDAVKDWIDEDDEPTGFGAENAFYKGREQPYSCKNGPLDSVDELLKIKGITKDLFYGSENTPGLRSYITVHSEGKINI
ncbi:MAG: general secretion pathway protein GspK, partial [Deltaproteobacteria bacterium]|nr:general secretion pathway protein GspK [Deltaproteobacteria bacterium]